MSKPRYFREKGNGLSKIILPNFEEKILGDPSTGQVRVSRTLRGTSLTSMRLDVCESHVEIDQEEYEKVQKQAEQLFDDYLNELKPKTRPVKKNLMAAWFRTQLETEQSKAKNHDEWGWKSADLHAHNMRMLEEALPILEAYSNTQSLTIATCQNSKCGKRYFDGSGKSKYCSTSCRVQVHKAKKK